MSKKLLTLILISGACFHLLVGCSGKNDPAFGNSTTIDNRISIGMNQLEDLHMALALNYEHRNLSVLSTSLIDKTAGSSSLFFLKVSYDLCEPCLVEAIESLKQFKENRPAREVSLIVNLTPREEKLFLPQFDLQGISIINLGNSDFSQLDSLKSDYFGVIKEQRIIEVFPVHQLISQPLYLAFLDAHD